MIGLGNLPDEALQHVLSFLPLQEAVQTCVLAQRWRYLWRSMSTLRTTSGSQSKRITEQGFHDLNIFVNNFLLRRDCKIPLHLCDFLIYPPGSVYSTEDAAAQIREDHAAQISFWIQRALLCKAQILRVRHDNIDEYYLALDNLRLSSQHLTTLELEYMWLESGFLDRSNWTSPKTVRMKFCCIDSDGISSQSLKRADYD
ncbi:hypothetical protein BAE44_0004992 [Dichanthelium oligosanthes]|uniref:F-box domain-containing protein n=1 Tax=Dichanthelium oligosanthes TaxID=888268 RepID=A0A1E5W9S7_9POAL|nr:hypothetical protein BAE44_0004992 [Dichanthelium oligosanthes]